MITVPKVEWDEMRDSVREIRSALVGNPALRQKGLIERVESIEAWQMDVRLKLAGAAAVVSGGVAAGWEALKHIFDKGAPGQ